MFNINNIGKHTLNNKSVLKWIYGAYLMTLRVYL